MTDIYNDFNFALLNSSEFKEDSVREEIISPLLKQLGYSASGPNQIIRSRNLLHPFVSEPVQKVDERSGTMPSVRNWR